jgi:hypothetical protein
MSSRILNRLIFPPLEQELHKITGNVSPHSVVGIVDDMLFRYEINFILLINN